VLTAAGAFMGILASANAARSYDRPSANATWEDNSLEFSGEISLLKASEFMTVTVYGYPPGWDTVELRGGQGEDRGSELFRSTTGPDAEGTAQLEGSITIDRNAYELIEVRVFRSGEDSQCLQAEAKAAPTACVQVWTSPRPPRFPPRSPGA
jgi:hypothetical protein